MAPASFAPIANQLQRNLSANSSAISNRNTVANHNRNCNRKWQIATQSQMATHLQMQQIAISANCKAIFQQKRRKHRKCWSALPSLVALLVAPPVVRVFDFVQNMVPLQLPCTAQCTQCFPRLLIITTITVLTCFIRCGTGAVVRRRLGAIRALHDGQKQVFVLSTRGTGT